MDMACEETVAPMTAIGFEGFEKRLEIEFFASSFYTESKGRGLRALTRAQLDEMLKAAKCTVVSELSNEHFDSYVLSESSLFVYPFKIILKTCGTTKLLLSIPLILSNASILSLSVKYVKYTRGTFIFPGAQSFPHRSFYEEISYLDKYFGALGSGGMAYVMGNSGTSYNWHIYSASADDFTSQGTSDPIFTLEMCMTQLDRERASLFYKDHCNSAAEMTLKSGISTILPQAKICDFEFDPCGYSMNSIEGPALSTVHVTPEDGFSYASFEAMGYHPRDCDLEGLVERVLSCFRPMTFSIAVHVNAGECQSSWTKPVWPQGYTCEMISQQELTGKGRVVYYTYSIPNAESPLRSFAWEAEREENDYLQVKENEKKQIDCKDLKV
jgi:S-adenosylmethionine decarboxylase